MSRTGRILLGALALTLLMPGCGGLTFVVEGCQGPYCDVECSVDADCPSGSRCLVGRCHTDDYEGGGGNQADSDDHDGAGGGDPLDGDGAPPSDQPPAGDGSGGADPAADSGPQGDPVVVFGDLSCVDPDQDGYCDCCPLGLDCDETDPQINAGALEICDGKDNDCQNGVDDGVKNACNNCEPYPICNTSTPWSGGSGIPGEGDLPPPGSSEDGTILDDSDGDGFGSVTLSTGSVATDFAWPASETQGSMSRIDTIQNLEIGRYSVVLVRADDVYRPYIADFGPTTQCQQPSRSTVDEFGNAYIANRANRHEGYSGNCTFPSNASTAPNYYGSISKIGYYHEVLCDPVQNPGLEGCACLDRNANNRIDTSRDYNSPPNGIQVPVCAGPGCGATGCTVDANCTGSDPTSQCIANFCTTCRDDNDCTGSGAGSQCIAGQCTTCREDANCAAGQYCIRELYPSQARGRCSTTVHAVHPCTGTHCAQSCVQNSNCPANHYCVRNNTAPTTRFCSTTPAIPEFLGKDDECLLWTRRIPGQSEATGNVLTDGTARRSKPRAMAIDKDGYIWVGDHENARAYKLRSDGEFVYPRAGAGYAVNDVCPRTAHKVSDNTVVASPAATCLSERCFWTIPAGCRLTLGLSPYGAVIDGGRLHPNGFSYVWFTNTNGNIQRIDTETGSTSVVFDTEGSYGISIDQHDRVWLADQGTDSAPNLHRFDPANPAFDPGSATCPACWSKFTPTNPTAAPWTSTTNWRGRGITTELLTDGSARIWAMFNNGWTGTPNYLVAFDADTGVEETGLRVRVDTMGTAPSSVACVGPVGVGIGSGGKVWFVNQSTSTICAFDPYSVATDLTAIPVGPGPYTYSDFTGNIFRSFTKPQGVYKVLVQGCPACFEVADWGLVTWEADTPGDSDLEVRFRVGATIGAAQNPANPQDGPVIQPSETFYDLPFVSGDWLQIEFKFLADDAGLAPKLHHVDVARSCRPRGEGC